MEFHPITLVWIGFVPYTRQSIPSHENKLKIDSKRRKYIERKQRNRLQQYQNAALSLADNSDDAAHMRHQKESRDKATRASENTANSERTSQHIISRDGETCASENASGTARMRQQRE